MRRAETFKNSIGDLDQLDFGLDIIQTENVDVELPVFPQTAALRALVTP